MKKWKKGPGGRMRGAARPEKIRADVLGSYTGTPVYDEKPVQDADDL